LSVSCNYNSPNSEQIHESKYRKQDSSIHGLI
jgi:hypothetical protein